MPSSETTLSIVLPVRNLQHTLARQVAELLEILPDLTRQFELLIIDDGSTDHTFEVAHDLEVQYPQVKVVRFRESLGAESVIRMGYENTSGDVVVVQPENTIPRNQDLLRMWQLRGDQGVVVARPEPATAPIQTLDRLSTLHAELLDDDGNSSPAEGMMIRREAVEEMVAAESKAVRERRDPPVQVGRRPIPRRFRSRSDELK